MRAAVYARKSTEQNVAVDAKSVTLQVELARAFITKHGWTVADDQVYVDDAISGADYVNRDGLNRLLAAAKAKPRPFDVLVSMSQDRIARTQDGNQTVLRALVDAGVRIFYYDTARSGSSGRRSRRSCPMSSPSAQSGTASRSVSRTG